MACVPKLTQGNISLARGIQCCPVLIFFYQSIISLLSITCMCTDTSDCVETVHELPSKPNNSTTEIFCKFRERCKVLTGCLSLGDRSGGDSANT